MQKQAADAFTREMLTGAEELHSRMLPYSSKEIKRIPT